MSRLISGDPLEVFDLAVVFARTRAWPLTAMALLTVGPIWLIALVAAWFIEETLWLLLLPVVFTPVLQAPFTMLTGRLLFDDVSIFTVLGEVLRRMPHLVAAWLVQAVGWVVTVATWLTGKRAEAKPFEFAKPLAPVTGTGIWDRMGMWTVVAVVLIAVAYAYPLFHLLAMPRFGSPGFVPY